MLTLQKVVLRFYNTMRKFFKFLQFLRFPMFLVPVVVFVVGIIEATHTWPMRVQDILSILSMVCMAAAMFTYNDYEDRAIDARKGNAFAFEHPRIALWVSVGLYTASLGLAITQGLKVASIFTVYAIGTLAYSRWIVKRMGWKNVVAAFLSAALLPMGGAIAQTVTTRALVMGGIVFFAILAMEIIKDIEDVPVDQGYRTTLPHVLPMQTTRVIVATLITTAILLGLLVRPSTGRFYLLMSPAILCFAIGTILLPTSQTPTAGRTSRRWLYAGLWFGAVAMVLFSLQ